MRFNRFFAAALGALGAFAASAGARADEIHNPTAIFAGLDKITGRITTFDVAIDETVQFGTLQITPRVCLTRPQTEAPLTEGFVQVDDVESGKAKRVFSGWMFAASPGLHGVEHPIFDVWLKDCVGGKEVTPSPPNAAADVNRAPPPNAAPEPKEGTPAAKARRTIEPREPVEPTMDSLPPSGPDVDSPGAQAPDGQAPDGQAPDAQAPDVQVPGDETPAPRAPETRRAPQPGSPEDLGAPIEVAPPPGMQPEGQPAAPPPARHSKPRRRQQTDPNAPVPPADIPQSAPQRRSQPSGPQDLLKNLPFFH
ncbi:DUF2155 domain-containing protein [Candidatus Rhodoblastus alkanivorans]|uniref:DUF2155 domain-containing protein n=1 Tax=Candidatus Rhodoblastus alkanivorans TaxID=2954117 RepID=UPI003CC83CD3